MLTTQTPEPRAIKIAGRFEVQETGDRPDSFYFLDLDRDRAEYVHIEFDSPDTAYAWREAPESTPYWLHRTAGGQWKCSCKASERGQRCYHLTCVEGAVLLRGEQPALAPAEAPAWRLPAAERVRIAVAMPARGSRGYGHAGH